MTHSVSHKLFIELNGSDLSLITTNKELQVISTKTYNVIDLAILSDALDQLPEIFADVTLLVKKSNFITIPEEFIDEEINSIYSLSYNLSDDFLLNIDKTDLGICIVYQIEKLYYELIKNKFPRINIFNESSIILRKIFREVNLKKSKIFITINDGQLIVFVINDNQLQLCNPYITKSNDDIFYFVMLTIEQLHIQPDETELIVLGEPPDRKAIFELFKNYINEINIWLEEYNVENQTLNLHLIDKSFALQQLLCGL